MPRQTGRLQPPFHHPADVDTGHGVAGKRPRFPVRRAEQGAVGDASRPDVGEQELLQIMPQRDFPRLVTFLGKPKRIGVRQSLDTVGEFVALLSRRQGQPCES